MKRALPLALLFVAVTSAWLASRLWDWVLRFDPGLVPVHEPIATGPPLTESVTVLLVDGLRVDASRQMPTLNGLRALGADIEVRVGTPSFSRPGRASLAVGATQEIHGVTTNRQSRRVPLDNLFRRVAEAGGRCLVAGSGIWPGLFGKDISHCGSYRPGEAKEGPGAFARQVGEVRSADRAGIDFVLSGPARLRVADIISTDFAAHEYGGASLEYAAEVARTDEVVRLLASRLDLTRETLIVTADHGHRDAGGHGGEEPEVLAVSVVMAGKGVRPGVRLVGSQSGSHADVAPTIAALLGLPIPAAATGHPLIAALSVDGEEAAALHRAADQQKNLFTAEVARRLLASGASSDVADAISAYRKQRIAARAPWAFVAFGLLGLTLGLCLWRGGAAALGALGTAGGLMAGPIGALWPSMSFSAINYDQMLVPYFRHIAALSAMVTLTALMAAFAVALAFKRRHRETTEVLAASGLSLVCVVGLLLTRLFWRQDLLDPMSLPGPDAMVTAFACTLAAGTASALTIAAFGMAWSVESRRGPTSALASSVTSG